MWEKVVEIFNIDSVYPKISHSVSVFPKAYSLTKQESHETKTAL